MPFSSNRPFASLNLGRVVCFGGFGPSRWILMNRPVFGSPGGMCFGVFWGNGLWNLPVIIIYYCNLWFLSFLLQLLNHFDKFCLTEFLKISLIHIYMLYYNIISLSHYDMVHLNREFK